MAIPVSDPKLLRLLRALLLASEHPLTASMVVDLVQSAVDEEEWEAPTDEATVEAAFRELQQSLGDDFGIDVVQLGGGWRFRTSGSLGFMVRRLWPDRAIRLSRAALEALSVVAYRQPCTRTDVEDVRGVDCGGVLRSLLERKMVKVVGRKEDVGHPLLYATTQEFLETFSLPDLGSLPRLRDLESMHAEEDAREKGFHIDHSNDATKDQDIPANAPESKRNASDTAAIEAAINDIDAAIKRSTAALNKVNRSPDEDSEDSDLTNPESDR